MDKTFILSTNEYKKYSTESSEKISSTTAIPTMTSNTLPSGIARASSFYSDGGGSADAYKAFNGTRTSDYDSWVVSSGTTGWLSYEFPVQKKIREYSLQTIYHTSVTDALARNPKSWTFEGSNDNGVNWTTLDTRSNITWTANEKKRFPISNQSLYKIYRLNITSNNGSVYLAVDGFEMFEEVSPASPSSWQTISPTLPTLPQFQLEGMDDLSIFDRKVQKVLESPIEMASEVLGVGKVYKASVDLNKYFDLRKLEVK